MKNRPNANNTQDLLPKGLQATIPALYAQENEGDKAIVHFKLFLATFTWFITEFNPETGIMFGFTISHMEPDGELGYISLDELQELKAPMGNAVERDISFKPTPLGEIKAFAGL